MVLNLVVVAAKNVITVYSACQGAPHGRAPGGGVGLNPLLP